MPYEGGKKISASGESENFSLREKYWLMAWSKCAPSSFRIDLQFLTAIARRRIIGLAEKKYSFHVVGRRAGNCLRLAGSRRRTDKLKIIVSP